MKEKKVKPKTKSNKQTKEITKVKKENKIQKEPKNKKHSIEKKQLTIENIKIIVCTIFAIYACFICYKTYNISLKNDNKNILNTPIDKETYEAIISYIPYYTFTSGIYNDAYNGNLTKASDVEDTLIAKSILGRYSESYTSKNGNTEDVVTLLKNNNLSEKEVVYYKSDIDNFLTQRYNVGLSMLNKLSANIINLNKKYLTVDIKSTFVPQRNKVSINYVAYKEGEDIILYEKAVFTELNTTNNVYYVYANSDIDSGALPIKIYNLTNETGEVIDINEAIKKDFADYKTMFKHTFKKNDTGYYWYSTELES